MRKHCLILLQGLQRRLPHQRRRHHQRRTGQLHRERAAGKKYNRAVFSIFHLFRLAGHWVRRLLCARFLRRRRCGNGRRRGRLGAGRTRRGWGQVRRPRAAHPPHHPPKGQHGDAAIARHGKDHLQLLLQLLLLNSSINCSCCYYCCCSCYCYFCC